ncbi:zinc-binding dehydrogenase [Aeromicrobium panaciterrae]|uniref:zinc-binding dehydrogenase n=1 Tax=Aeromicrobium panaciterrae TaxID=363861 RepID=UPI0031D82FB2
MRAVTCHQSQLSVVDLETPVPATGQVLLEVQRCGICGSDLHARVHGDELGAVMVETGYDDFMRSDQHVILGHELYGVVADHGPGTTKKLATGTPVVSLPLLRNGTAVDALGLSAKAPGAYAEYLVTQENLTLKVPNGLAADVAVLTEPMAVGWHAVARGEVRKKDVAVVVGCGPVGLAVITILKSRGVRTIIASDPSPGRRALATRLGATSVVDPTEGSPFATAKDHKHFTTVPDTLGAAMDAIDQMSRLPVGWWHAWRAADKVGATNPKAPVIFECVGNPGMIDSIMAGAPLFSRIVVVGVCMGGDQIRPSMAINKEIDLRFVIGYTPLEFRDTLHALADGTIDPSAMLTGRVGLDGVATAFDALGDPETHAKIVIDPRLDGSQVHAR